MGDGPKRVACRTDRQYESLFSAIEQAPAIGFDTESDGPNVAGKRMLNVHRSTLAGVSFSTGDRSWYVAVNHRKHNCDLHRLGHLFQAMRDSDATWACHSLKHEIHAARSAPIPWVLPERVACTQVLSHLTQQGVNQGKENVSFGLKALTREHLGMDQMDFDTATKGYGVGAHDSKDPDLLRYVCEDAEGALGLFSFLPTKALPGQMDLFWRTRGRTPRAFAQMEQTGIGLDFATHERNLRTFDARVAALREQWEFLAPGTNPGSSKQLQALYDNGTWSTKDIPKTTHGYSTEKEYIGWQLQRCKPGSLGHALAECKVELSRLTKLVSTYGYGLIRNARQYPDFRVHGSFNPTGTQTGRPSSSDPNMLNFPVRTEEGKLIRQALVSRDGWTLVSADYSQVELRILAHLLREGRLFTTLLQGGDPHQATADLAGVDRAVGKFLNFAIIYGVGLHKLAKVAGVDFRGAKRIMDTLLRNEPGIAHLKQSVVEATRQRGYVRTLAGRHQVLPYINSRNGDLRMSAERKAFNTPHQGGAADIMDAGMMAMWDRMDHSKCRFVVQVYDDLVCEMRDDYVEEGSALLQECLEGAWPTLRVPLVVDPARGKRWSEHKS